MQEVHWIKVRAAGLEVSVCVSQMKSPSLLHRTDLSQCLTGKKQEGENGADSCSCLSNKKGHGQPSNFQTEQSSGGAFVIATQSPPKK